MTEFAKWLLGIIEKIISLIIELPLSIIEYVWKALLDLIDSSFIVGFLDGASQISSQISPNVVYFMDIMQIPFGIGAVTSAYLLRFLVRRIPFIG